MASGSGNGGDSGTAASTTLPNVARVATLLPAPPAPSFSTSTRASEDFIKTVEWHMLDKQKFYPLSMLSSFSVRCFLYPLTLVRTRLQVQGPNSIETNLALMLA